MVLMLIPYQQQIGENLDKNEFTCVDDCKEPLTPVFVKNWLIRFDSEDEAANFVLDAFFNETGYVHFMFGEDIYSVSQHDASQLIRPHITVYYRTFRVRVEFFPTLKTTFFL